MGNITVQSLPKSWNHSRVLLMLPSLPSPYICSLISFFFFFFFTPASKTESRSQNLGVYIVQHSKVKLFEKPWVQSGLFLLILCKLGGRRQKEQTERHDNSTAATYVVFQGDAVAGCYSAHGIPVTPRRQSRKSASLARCSFERRRERSALNKASVIFPFQEIQCQVRLRGQMLILCHKKKNQPFPVRHSEIKESTGYTDLVFREPFAHQHTIIVCNGRFRLLTTGCICLLCSVT